MGEGGREVVYLLVETFAEGKVGEGGREVVYGRVEFKTKRK